jgi:hypothetical protein
VIARIEGAPTGTVGLRASGKLSREGQALGGRLKPSTQPLEVRPAQP